METVAVVGKLQTVVGRDLLEASLRVRSELLKSTRPNVSTTDILSVSSLALQGGFSHRPLAASLPEYFSKFRVSETTKRVLSVNKTLLLPDTPVVRAQITSADVIHSWTIPGLGVRIDAVPGKLYALKLPFKYYGIFSGQCSEVCGLRHAYMPISINFVSYAVFSKAVFNLVFSSLDFFFFKFYTKDPLFNLVVGYLLVFIVKYVLIFHVFSLFFTFILAQGERKLLATATRRLGPSVSYANGTLQAVPDLFKFLTKTATLSYRVNQTYYRLAGVYSLLSGYFLWFIWAFGFSGSNFLNFDYGFFFFMLVTVVNVYAIILGGFTALSKYGILSSLRVIGQLFSFDIIQNLLMCTVLALFGTFSFEEISLRQHQAGTLLPVEALPLVLLGFLAMLLENFRVPFDLSEAEAEIITGYTVEYYGFLFFAFLFSEFLSLWNGIIFFNQIFLSAGLFFY